MNIKPLILIILDGFGIAPPSRGNAITLAKMPTYWAIKNKYPYTELCASGKCVGLPPKQNGNSEAGHLNLGTGRTVESDGLIISKSIKDGTFFKNPILLEGINYTKKHHSKIHLMGLITEEQSAHSNPEHWWSMLDLLNRQGVGKVYLHLFTDGRDSPQHAAIKIIQRFEGRFRAQHNHDHSSHRFEAQIASVSGRFYAMDRTKKWEHVEEVYDLLVLGRGLAAKSGEEAIVQAYNRQETDEYIKPTAIVKNGQPVATIDGNDLIIFMNLRSDRARELTKAFAQREFNKNNLGSFHRKKWLDKLFFIALTDFGPDLDLVRTAYPSRVILNSLPFLLKDYRQLYISEEEKFAHVTFFFNGGYDHPVVGEDRVMIPSVQVQSYDLKPEMSAGAVAKYLISDVDDYDFVTVNFANPDMLGHTGNLAATIKGLEFMDKCLDKLIGRILSLDGTAIITADHGNAEEMINLKTGEINTEHSTNPVPFILVGHNYKKVKLTPSGVLADVAPTVLELKNVAKSSDIRGKSLITSTYGKN